MEGRVNKQIKARIQQSNWGDLTGVEQKWARLNTKRTDEERGIVQKAYVICLFPKHFFLTIDEKHIEIKEDVKENS